LFKLKVIFLSKNAIEFIDRAERLSEFCL